MRQPRWLRRALAAALVMCALGGPSALRAAEPPCAAPAALGDGWEVAPPAAQGIDAQALCATLAAALNGEHNVHGIVVERHGHLVAERYRRGPDRPITVLFGLWNPLAGEVDFGPTTPHDVRSITKSVVGLLVGIAIERGAIAGVDTPVLRFYPEFAALQGPPRDAITLAHLLSMSSGLDWDEGALPNDETRLFFSRDPVWFVLDRPLAAPPGARFHYNSGGTTVLADVVRRATGTSVSALARAELFAPLGIADWEWETDVYGRELAFGGLRLRPRDLMRLGRLVLEHGQWRGRQVVPGAWVADALRPHIATGLGPPTEPFSYGYQWWTGHVAWRGQRLAWSAGFGNGGQRLFVVPALDLAVVVTAGEYGSAAIAPVVHQLFGDIVAAVRE